MKRYDLIIVGAGPAGLSAAIVAAGYGLTVIVFDENARPGGQLFKQIHKFFGSREHKARIRGYRIGQELLAEAERAGVQVELNATVLGIFAEREVTIRQGDGIRHFKADAVLMATGASENAVVFDGWTLPGVIGAGAAQTMMNLHGIQPGKRILMLGSGNVGLVVAFQLLQAGCEVAAIVDASPRIGGYGVHAAKVARCGVPFYLAHTILHAEGGKAVNGVTITEVDSQFRPISGTEKHFDVDTICLAVGLSPMSQLSQMAGCAMEDTPGKGGTVPVCDPYGRTSVPGIYAAGDAAGIEEASSAMIEGRLAGVAAAYDTGFIESDEFALMAAEQQVKLGSLRQGMFAPGKKGRQIALTDEGIATSQTLLEHGYLSDAEVERYPGVTRRVGIHPVMECTQNIPCNPCRDACPKGCIRVNGAITALPSVNDRAQCIGCGMCVAACSGQAIFLVNEDSGAGCATVTLPYEFLPLPKKADRGIALSRSGEPLCEAEVVEVRTAEAFDHTALLTIRVPLEMSGKARFYKRN